MFFSALRRGFGTRYDLVHAVEEAGFIGLALKLFLRIPYVYDMDSSLSGQIFEKHSSPRWFRRVFESLEGLMMRHSLGVVAVCDSLEKIAREAAPKKLIATIEDKSLLDSCPPAGEETDELISVSGRAIMYIGNFESYQGIDLLLESHQQLVRAVPDAHLVLIGGVPVHIDQYQKMAMQLGIAEQTHFLGQRPNSQLGHFLRQADVLVSPRISGENTPMKIYSYMDSGKPIVATRLGTHTQVLDDDIACLVQPDPVSMASGLARLIGDPELGRQIARRAKLRVERLYGAEAFDRKVNNFYAQVEFLIRDSSET
jgi:glycosyltransferase involved in cell wall biosynthesis